MFSNNLYTPFSIAIFRASVEFVANAALIIFCHPSSHENPILAKNGVMLAVSAWVNWSEGSLLAAFTFVKNVSKMNTHDVYNVCVSVGQYN